MWSLFKQVVTDSGTGAAVSPDSMPRVYGGLAEDIPSFIETPTYCVHVRLAGIRTQSTKPRIRTMSFSMSQASLPVFDISLNALSSILDKAEAHAAAKKVDSSVLLHSRLSPDMFALVRQVQIATDQAKNGSARLAGVKAPSYEDNETTMDELKTRIARTVAYLKTLDPKQIDSSADREISVPLGPTNTGHMKGDEYLTILCCRTSISISQPPTRSCAIAAWTLANVIFWAQSP
jgi:hypothetical protein